MGMVKYPKRLTCLPIITVRPSILSVRAMSEALIGPSHDHQLQGCGKWA